MQDLGDEVEGWTSAGLGMDQSSIAYPDCVI